MHVGVLASQRGEVRGIADVNRQRERRAVGGEGDAADEELRAAVRVGKRRAGVGLAGLVTRMRLVAECGMADLGPLSNAAEPVPLTSLTMIA